MKRWLKHHGLLVLIVFLAFFLRIWRVTEVPPSLSWDEASIGYNAYSILTTGKDEHGRFLPLDTFPAFGDYKPPVPVYLTVPFVAVFGLNELAVRLPSVIAGTLTVLVAYLLVIELLGESTKSQIPNSKQYQSTKVQNSKPWNHNPTLPPFILRGGEEGLSLLSALLLAISPWHILLSRAGFEGNIALLFIVLGMWLIVSSRNNPRLIPFLGLPFVAAMYIFNSARYAGPLLAIGAFVYAWNGIRKYKKSLALGLVLTILALFPILPHLLSKESRLRFHEVSIFTDLRTVLTSNSRRELDGFSWWSNILHNRRIGYAREYLVHFFDHFEPRFLFVRGDGNPKFSIQDVGQLYLIEAPFLVLGLLGLFSTQPKVAWLLIWWMLAAIAPAAVARETPHALRIENSLPVWQIFTAYGVISTISNIKYQISKIQIKYQKVIELAVYGGVIVAFTGNFVYFWHTYMTHYPKEFSSEWQYGYRDAVLYAESVKDQYDTIVLTESIGRPYIYALFYGRYHPNYFWKTKDASFDAAGFYNAYGFGKYRFTREGIGSYKGRVLYILPPKHVPEGKQILKTIRLLNGDTVLVAFE